MRRRNQSGSQDLEVIVGLQREGVETGAKIANEVGVRIGGKARVEIERGVKVRIEREVVVRIERGAEVEAKIEGVEAEIVEEVGVLHKEPEDLSVVTRHREETHHLIGEEQVDMAAIEDHGLHHLGDGRPRDQGQGHLREGFKEGQGHL